MILMLSLNLPSSDQLMHQVNGREDQREHKTPPVLASLLLVLNH